MLPLITQFIGVKKIIVMYILVQTMPMTMTGAVAFCILTSIV